MADGVTTPAAPVAPSTPAETPTGDNPSEATVEPPTAQASTVQESSQRVSGFRRLLNRLLGK